MEHAKPNKPVFQSESSVITHPYRFPPKSQFTLPTWGLLLILIGAFFALKYFIYIADEKRHGK
ncbi:MAG: hypothetical protein V4598_07520 [Bdellovibrionota bacterium]